MSDKKTLGEAIFVDIESNTYLNELHENILFNYALKLFQIQDRQREYNLNDALRFADLLSKSTHPTNSDSHKMWAQELIILLNELHPEDGLVKLYAGSVFRVLVTIKACRLSILNIRILMCLKRYSNNSEMII